MIKKIWILSLAVLTLSCVVNKNELSNKIIIKGKVLSDNATDIKFHIPVKSTIKISYKEKVIDEFSTNDKGEFYREIIEFKNCDTLSLSIKPTPHNIFVDTMKSERQHYGHLFCKKYQVQYFVNPILDSSLTIKVPCILNLKELKSDHE